MHSLYVFALTDTPLKPWSDGERNIETVPVSGIFAVCERRSSSPEISEEELRRQHDIVMRIADAAPAVLPARFGSLVDESDLAKTVRDRAAIFRDALERVRGNVQMTVRIAVEKGPPMKRAESGRAYLQQRLDIASPAVPPRARRSLNSIRPLVLDERRRGSDASMVTICHLIRRADVQEYNERVGRAAVAGMLVSGPWPAFAFVPDL